VTKFSGIIGRSTGTNATLRFSAYDTDSSKNPQTRVGDSASATASAAYTGPPPGASIGARVDALVETSDNGPTNAGIMLFSGKRYAIDMVVRSATLAHSMKAAAFITVDNPNFYNRTSAASPPSSAYGSYAASVEGQMTVWMEGWLNSAPVTPASGLYPTGSVSETVSTFTADFKDLNGAYGTSSTLGVDTGDQLNQYQIQVRRVSDGTLFWNQGSINAGSSQKAANAISIDYNGTTLVRGTAYEWRVRMSDQFSAWSNWSAWTAFTPANLGFVTLDSTPTGKVLAVSGSTALDFKGRWNHQAATTMTKAQTRLLDGNGTVLQTGPQVSGYSVASSALPGTLFTQTWAQTTFTALGWGRSYKYQIRGFDGTQWSDWSAARAFTTNAAPTVPVLSSPTGGIVLTAFPKLAATFTDADDLYTGTLTGVFRITRPNATSKKWEFQTTSTQLSAFGVYAWKATGYDGTLYSGEKSSLGTAIFSSSATFDYETGPAVTVTSPSDGATIATASLAVTWTTTGQVKYQVRVYADGTSTVVYDSGLVTSATGSHTIPSGYLRNGLNYDLVVSSTNATPLTGSSTIVNIAVAFTAPTAVQNLTFAPYNDYSLRAAWDQTGYSAPEFVETTLTIQADGGPDAVEKVIARLTSPTDVSFIYDNPASGYTYTITATVVTLTGVDVLESNPVTADASVTIPATVLSLLGNGQTYRVVLPNVTARDHSRTLNESVYPSLSGSKPTTIRSRLRYWTSSFTALILATKDDTAAEIVADFDALDAQNGVVVYRDSIGRKRFCKLTDYKLTDQAPNDFYEASFQLREEAASEAADLAL
jgi:hypothetical protein